MKSRLVWRSDTGERAWQAADSGLPPAYRRILGLAARPTSVATIVERLGDYSAKQIEDWLDELETLCFVHASTVDPTSRDLLAA